MCLDGFAQQEEPVYSLHFAGNGSKIDRFDSALQIIEKSMQRTASKSGLLLLGDNFNPNKKDYTQIAGFHTPQVIQNLKSIQSNADVYILNGEGEWDDNGNKGFQKVQFMDEYLDTLFNSSVIYPSQSGCPGPYEVPVNDLITLAAFDSQWILHPWDKSGRNEACSTYGVDEILTGLKDIIERNYDKIVVVAMHHPLVMEGTNYNALIPSNQKYIHPVYKAYSSYFLKELTKHKNVILLSSHDSYQGVYHVDGLPMLLTSLSVEKEGKKIKDRKELAISVYKSAYQGFGRLDFFKNGKVNAVFWELQKDGSLQERFNKEIIELEYVKKEAISEFTLPDSLSNQYKTPISTQYNNMNTWWFGNNYRKSWATAVNFDVFDIGKEKGGLKIIKRGGGQQTRSLRLQADDGKQYVLRSIEKYAQGAVPEDLRKTIAADLVQDQISASHPYGAFAIPKLADAAQVYHTNPQPVYLPHDPRFGQYRNDFSNDVFLYEERPSGNWKGTGNFGDSKKIISTFDLIKKLKSDNDEEVDQHWVLKSRLFDMMIGDWDRHDDQWRWARFKTKKGHYYRPIPRDRDQAFFINDGVVMSFVGKKWAMPKFQGFDDKYKNLNEFNFNGRYFDRDFINEPSRAEWVAIAKELQKNVTDEVIANALHTWPDSVYAKNGAEIERKIRSNRDHLVEYANTYYEFLAKLVNVDGSNKHEEFNVRRFKNGDALVEVYKINKKGKKGKNAKLLYKRHFYKQETKEIRLYGLKGNDVFIFTGKGKKGIKVRVIGGEGKDVVKDSSHIAGLRKKIFVYDNKEGNGYKKTKEVNLQLSKDPEVNNYNRNQFKYNTLMPLLSADINPDDGFFIGAGFTYENQGFRKEPFKSRHFVMAKIAPKTQSYSFNYKTTWTDIIKKWSMDLEFLALMPNYTSNFFGIGNETVYDKNISESLGLGSEIEYYRVRFRNVSAYGALSNKISGRSKFSVGLHFQAFKTEQDYNGEDRFILDYAETVEDPNFFEWKKYSGLVLSYDFDTRDKDMYPKSGAHFSVDLRGYENIGEEATEFTRFKSEFSFYKTLRLPSELTWAVRFGGGINFGEYEYFQAQILGDQKELRGYRKTRFFGDAMAFTNMELRFKLLESKNKILPMTIGINGFTDIGRVWVDKDPSKVGGNDSSEWHNTIGGGVWIAPLNAFVLNVDVGVSEEEVLGYLRLGFLF